MSDGEDARRVTRKPKGGVHIRGSTEAPVLCKVLRSSLVASLHRGHIAVADTEGRLLFFVVNHPYMVAGKDRLCTGILTALRGEVVAKGGGEAVYCVATRDTGIGLCVKIEDGTFRAVGPAVIEALRQLGIAKERHLAELSEFYVTPMKNCRDEVIGEIRADFRLNAMTPVA